MENPLDALVYISVPENSIKTAIPEFDPSIPLPVRLENSHQRELDTSNITAEMILAGMLTVFAYDRKNKHIEYFRKIFKLWRPDIRTEMTEAAILKIKNGDFDMGEEILSALEGLNPEDLLPKLNLALLMEERSESYKNAGFADKAACCTDKAFELYKILIGSEPPIPDVFFNAAFFYLKQKKYAGSKELFQTYLILETSDSETAKLRRQKAENIVASITKQYLDNELFAHALEHIQNEKDNDALEKIHEFLQLYPKAWNGWFILGWALRKQKRWEDAKAAFTQCLELFKKNDNETPDAYSDICNELAICLMETNRLQEAEKLLLEAVTKEPENIKFISNLGVLALKQNDKHKAHSFFKTVLAINPDDKMALEMLKANSI